MLPHEANDYQPHLIRRYGILAVLLLIFCVHIYNFSTTGSVLGDNANVSAEMLLEQTNDVRLKQDLSTLKLSDKLNQAAQLKVENMFEQQYWGHDAPDGTKPWKWLAEAGYNYTEAGENLAKNFYTAEAATDAWMNSPEHRDNIVKADYTEAGFAVRTGMLDDQPATIIVALYGRPVGAGAASAHTVAGAKGGSISLVARLGIGVQSITPAALGSIIVLIFLMIIAFAAHLYRDYIPVAANHPRHRHNHGAIKMGLMFMFLLAMLILYGGGQI